MGGMGGDCPDVSGVGWFIIFLFVACPAFCIWRVRCVVVSPGPTDSSRASDHHPLATLSLLLQCGPCKGTCPPRIVKDEGKSKLTEGPTTSSTAASDTAKTSSSLANVGPGDVELA